jgi:hypothetical protein
MRAHMASARQRRQLHSQKRDASQRDIAVTQGGSNMTELGAAPSQLDRHAVAGAE